MRIFQELGDKNSIGSALLILSNLSMWMGDIATSQFLVEQSLAIMREINNAWGVGNCLIQMKFLAETNNEFGKVRQLGEEAAAMIKTTGDRWCLSYHLNDLNWAIWDNGETEKARLLFEENLQIYREFGDRRGEAITLGELAHIETFHGDYEKALTLAHNSLAISRDLGEGFVYLQPLMGELMLWKGDLSGAQAIFEEAHQLVRSVREVNMPERLGLILDGLGRCMVYQGKYLEAKAFLSESLAVLEQARHVLNANIDQRLTLRDLGDLARAQGETAQAADWYRKSLAVIKYLGCKPYAPETIEGLAKVAGIQGQTRRAVLLFAAAQAARNWMETPLPPLTRPDYERSLGAVREALGREAFTAAWEEGLVLTLEQAMVYALEESG